MLIYENCLDIFVWLEIICSSSIKDINEIRNKIFHFANMLLMKKTKAYRRLKFPVFFGIFLPA